MAEGRRRASLAPPRSPVAAALARWRFIQVDARRAAIRAATTQGAARSPLSPSGVHRQLVRHARHKDGREHGVHGCLSVAMGADRDADPVVRSHREERARVDAGDSERGGRQVLRGPRQAAHVGEHRQREPGAAVAVPLDPAVAFIMNVSAALRERSSVMMGTMSPLRVVSRSSISRRRRGARSRISASRSSGAPKRWIGCVVSPHRLLVRCHRC